VTRAVAAQLATLNTNTRYLHEVAIQYAEELAATFPAPLEVCYFTASGSEANELALRLARAHTGQRDLIVMEAAYHGHTTTLIDISPYKHAGPGGRGAPDWVHTSPIPDVYRGPHKANDPEAALEYAREVGAVVEAIRERGHGLCGYISETCPSVGGQIFMPAGFLPEVYRLVRAAGGVCIADEVQTGFGRLGTHFWAFEAHGVVPDIVVLGKPIANGYPMGAVLTTRAIATTITGWSSSMPSAKVRGMRGGPNHFGPLERKTFRYALRVAATTGGPARVAKHELIGDVRGSGLFVGVELVRSTIAGARNRGGRDGRPHAQAGRADSTDGPHHNVIKIRGPMPLAEIDADCIVAALARALREL
jgi:4-aminobutyrate aminotransferase-like enzyme